MIMTPKCTKATISKRSNTIEYNKVATLKQLNAHNEQFQNKATETPFDYHKIFKFKIKFSLIPTKIKC